MRHDVTFGSEGAYLEGWDYASDSEPPWPLVVMAHGFSATRHMSADNYAEAFRGVGLAVLLYDYLGCGKAPMSSIRACLKTRLEKRGAKGARTCTIVDGRVRNSIISFSRDR